MENYKRYIITGDVHGCLLEFRILLAEVMLDSKTDTLVLIGDLLDKGKFGPEVVTYVRNLARIMPVKLLLGNHEEKNLRFFKHAAREKLGITNPMVNSPSVHILRDNWERLSKDDIKFIENESLLYYEIPEHNVLVVHAGIPPGVKELPSHEELAGMSRNKKKTYNQMIRIRWVRGGKMVSFGEEQPEDPFWADDYDGRFGHVIFGHESMSLEEPSEYPHATGIDLACIYGGHLCAAILSEDNLGNPTYVKIPYGGDPQDAWSADKEK